MAYKHWQLHNIYSILIIISITIDVIDTYFNIHLSYIKNQAGTLVLHFDALICNVSMRNVCVEFYGVYGTRKHEKKQKMQNRIQKQTLNQESCASLRQVQLTY